MQDFFTIMAQIWSAFGMPMTVYGFTFSFKSVFFFTIAAGIVGAFIGSVLRGYD